MGKGKHHYVPRFYLAHFASQPKRINVYNFRDSRSYHDVGLRDQCYRAKLYGDTDELEEALSSLETDVAPVIRSIVEGTPLTRYSIEHALCLLFVALQLCRTPRSSEVLTHGLESFANKLLSLYPESNDLVLSFKEPIMPRVGNFGIIAEYINDLAVRLLINNSSIPFITSDNPAVEYNLYCEGVRHTGTTGAASTGLIIFLPLSPRHMLFLYDEAVYQVSPSNAVITRVISEIDAKYLNLLQAVTADRILLYSDQGYTPSIKRLAEEAMPHRGLEPSLTEEFSEVGSTPGGVLLHTYYPPANICLNLRFLKVKGEAKGIPLIKRAMQYRRPLPQFGPPPPDLSSEGVTRTYLRRS